MSESEILEWLKKSAKRKPWRRSTIPDAALAAYLGISRKTLIKWRKAWHVPQRMRLRVSIALCAIDHGVLVCEHTSVKKGAAAMARLVYQEAPEVLPPAQEKMVRAGEWERWARCKTCDGNRWSRVLRGAAQWMVCNHCVPPAQYVALALQSAA